MHSAARFASSVPSALKESLEECRCLVRDTDDLIRCLTIEFEIEFGFGSMVVPVAKTFQFAAVKTPLGERGAGDGDAHTRRLPGDPVFLRDRFGRSDDAARNETWPAFVLARENEDRIVFSNVLPSVHRLLIGESELFRPRIANLGLDREHHFCPPLTNSRYSSQNAETFFRPELRSSARSSARVSG